MQRPQRGNFTSINVSFGGVTLINTTGQDAYGYTLFQYLVTASGSSSTLSFDIRQTSLLLPGRCLSSGRDSGTGFARAVRQRAGLGSRFLRKFRS